MDHNSGSRPASTPASDVNANTESTGQDSRRQPEGPGTFESHATTPHEGPTTHPPCPFSTSCGMHPRGSPPETRGRGSCCRCFRRELLFQCMRDEVEALTGSLEEAGKHDIVLGLWRKLTGLEVLYWDGSEREIHHFEASLDVINSLLE